MLDVAQGAREFECDSEPDIARESANEERLPPETPGRRTGADPFSSARMLAQECESGGSPFFAGSGVARATNTGCIRQEDRPDAPPLDGLLTNPRKDRQRISGPRQISQGRRGHYFQLFGSIPRTYSPPYLRKARVAISAGFLHRAELWGGRTAPKSGPEVRNLGVAPDVGRSLGSSDVCAGTRPASVPVAALRLAETNFVVPSRSAEYVRNPRDRLRSGRRCDGRRTETFEASSTLDRLDAGQVQRRPQQTQSAGSNLFEASTCRRAVLQ